MQTALQTTVIPVFKRSSLWSFLVTSRTWVLEELLQIAYQSFTNGKGFVNTLGLGDSLTFIAQLLYQFIQTLVSRQLTKRRTYYLLRKNL